MVTPLERLVRMPAHQHRPNHTGDIRYGGQQTDHDVALDPETLDDCWSPESKSGICAYEAKADGGQEPHLWELGRFAEPVLPGASLAMIRLEIGDDELLLALAKPACLAGLVD